MSKADQLLSKLPPPTPLPPFVTDALNGNHFMQKFVFIFFRVFFFFLNISIELRPVKTSSVLNATDMTSQKNFHTPMFS